MSIDLKILPSQGYHRATWKNGLGHTDEIAIHPPGSELKKGNFHWRVSSAQIERNSPFSVFPDHDRILIILQGKGVKLIHTFVEGEPEESVEIAPLMAYEFPGDVPSRCELLEGAVQDLSVFFRKGHAQAQIEVLHFSAEEIQEHDSSVLLSGRWNFLFAVSGHFEVNYDSQTAVIPQGDCLKVELLSSQCDGPLMIRHRSNSGSVIGGALLCIQIESSSN